METCKSGSERGAEESMVRNHHIGASASTLRQATASEADHSVTRKLVEAGRLLGIPVEDHVIIGHDSFFSFRQERLL
jgi:DNA repair protein RadC